MGMNVWINTPRELDKIILSWYGQKGVPLSEKYIRENKYDAPAIKYLNYWELSYIKRKYPLLVFVGDKHIGVYEGYSEDYMTGGMTFDEFSKISDNMEYFVHVRTTFKASEFERLLQNHGYTLLSNRDDTIGVTGCFLISTPNKYYTYLAPASLPTDFLSATEFVDLFL